MQSILAIEPGGYRDEPGRRRLDWITNGLLSGFAATFAMTVTIVAAYWFARAAGDPAGTQIERWFHALHSNALTRQTEDAVVLAIGLNLLVGLGWALLFGYIAAPLLPGPCWFRGMLFALVPWVLSITVFFPIMDAGIFGRDLGAGPLPVIGNLVLHLVYGAVLGSIYGIDLETGLSGSESDLRHNRAALSGGAVGMLIGVPIGLIGARLIGPTIDQVVGMPIVALFGAVLGATLGLMVGMFAGLERAGKGTNAERSNSPR